MTSYKLTSLGVGAGIPRGLGLRDPGQAQQLLCAVGGSSLSFL